MGKFQSTKIIELGSAAFRQPKATSHCKFVHGYRLKAKIWLEANELDSNNWVFDFGSFKEIKTELEKVFDHKLVIDKNDPAKHVFKELERYGAVDITEMDGVGIEKFAEYVFNYVDGYVKVKTNNRVWCERVEVFEHENNSAIFLKEKIATVIEKVEPKLVSVVTEEPTLKTETVQPQPSNQPRPVSVGAKVTTGWSNPFGGTSWGA